MTTSNKLELSATLPKVSTETIISDINSRVDLELVFKNLEHYPCGLLVKERCDMCTKKTYHEIISLRKKDFKPKGKPRKETINRKNSRPKKEFYNQITIDISPKKGRQVSTKLFIDGNIQMAGCKDEEEANLTINILIENLKKIAHITEPGDMMLGITQERHDELRKMEEDKNNGIGMTESEWRNHLFSIKGEKPVKGANKFPKDKYKYIRKAVEFPDQLKPLFYKIAMINSDFKYYYANNVDQDVSIDREKLHKILSNEYNIYCRPFEASRYPGVNAKYISSVGCVHGCKDKNKINECVSKSKTCINPHPLDESVHKCMDRQVLDNCVEMTKKGKISNGCVTVTILAFQQGKVILTGARSNEQLYDAYNFIVGVYKNNFDRLKYNHDACDSSDEYSTDED